MKLLLFEFKKMMRTKTVLYFFLLTVLFIVALFGRNVAQQDLVPLKKAEYFWEFSTDVAGQNRTDQQRLEEFDDSKLEEKLLIGQQLHGLLRELIQAIEDGEWEKELAVENEVYKTAMTYRSMNGRFLIGQLDMEDVVRTNEALQKIGIPKEDMDLSVQRGIFMKKIYGLFFTPFGFLLVLLVLGSGITKEFEEGNTRWIYTLPIQKWKYTLLKFGSMGIVGLLWIGLLTALSALLPLLVAQPEGDIFQYPLLSATGEMTSVSAYLTRGFGVAIGFLLFAVSLLVWMSYLFRHTILTSVALFILLMGGWASTFYGFSHVLYPLSYQRVDHILLATPQYLPMGFVVLGVGCLLFLGLTINSNRKRGI